MAFIALLVVGATSSARAQSSAAYGTINNFDVVNGTGQECHGFEIEIEDVHSADITYTYGWNHYGTPRISEDNSNPAHPRVIVRYAAVLTNGGWSAYTSIPTNAIAPTDGHQFTNPSVNFGGEHFGCGYLGSPTNITYHWLVDDGSGALVRGEAVNVATPQFSYVPPQGGGVAQVEVELPVAPARPEREYGPATWVKSIKTSTHNNREVRLRDLVSDDPNDERDRNWRNGEPAEVEVEWQLLQFRFSRPGGGKNAKLKARPEELPQGDEVITRRYEFFKYGGPLDPASGEALTETVGPDGLHGIGDYENTVVVGEYLGAQMSAFDVAAPVGLIEQVQDGVVNEVYPNRLIVIGGNLPFLATNSGALPAGLSFDGVTGQLSGTPTESGVFSFTVGAVAGNNPAVRRTYTITIAPSAAAVLPPRSTIDTVAEPLEAGVTQGNGTFANGSEATVVASASPGFAFSHWEENGRVVSSSSRYTFTNVVNRSLVAIFVRPLPPLQFSVPQPNTLRLTWPTNLGNARLEMSLELPDANWAPAQLPETIVGTNRQVLVSPLNGRVFFRLAQPQP